MKPFTIHVSQQKQKKPISIEGNILQKQYYKVVTVINHLQSSGFGKLPIALLQNFCMVRPAITYEVQN